MEAVKVNFLKYLLLNEWELIDKEMDGNVNNDVLIKTRIILYLALTCLVLCHYLRIIIVVYFLNRQYFFNPHLFKHNNFVLFIILTISWLLRQTKCSTCNKLCSCQQRVILKKLRLSTILSFHKVLNLFFLSNHKTFTTRNMLENRLRWARWQCYMLNTYTTVLLETNSDAPIVISIMPWIILISVKN